MTYLPSDLINENYIYSFDNNNIIVLKNCENNLCVCNSVLTDLDYQVTNDFFCSETDYKYFINYNNFSDSVYYRKDLSSILTIFIIFCIICLLIPLKVFMRFFKKGGL